MTNDAPIDGTLELRAVTSVLPNATAQRRRAALPAATGCWAAVKERMRETPGSSDCQNESACAHMRRLPDHTR